MKNPKAVLSSQKVDTINFTYNNHNMVCKVVINQKTYDFIFDTGASNTVLGGSVNYSRFIRNEKFTDARDISHTGKTVMLDSLRLGRTLFHHFDSYLYVDSLDVGGIIGGDLLKEQAWKINFLEQTIQFSDEVENLEPTGRGVPFILADNNIPFIDIKLDDADNVLTFLMDTGFSEFLSIRRSDKKVNLPDAEKMIKWIELSPYPSVFSYEGDDFIDTSYYSIQNISVGDCILRDEIISYIGYGRSNLLGMDFFHRFEYVIFDYPGKTLYLGPKVFKSHKYLTTLNARINAIGLQVGNKPIHRIIAVNDIIAYKEGIDLRDTILEINHVPVVGQPPSFYEDVIDKDKIVSAVKVTPSKWNKLTRSFHYQDRTATLKVMRGNSFSEVALQRGNYFSDIPDTILAHSFKPLAWLPRGYAGHRVGKGSFIFFKGDSLSADKSAN
ncbi:retropepsin-like aspartic protease [Fulvivirga sp. M361]|uniref:retropepsin-like aspartic protease n=1 Tax=Fulvivirga sp. M361 TaxID=2594266 RepID=UPI00162A54EA|nr:retropepsin-like aspartic protease [Fulvivirga sp. M361]